MKIIARAQPLKEKKISPEILGALEKIGAKKMRPGLKMGLPLKALSMHGHVPGGGPCRLPAAEKSYYPLVPA